MKGKNTQRDNDLCTKSRHLNVAGKNWLLPFVSSFPFRIVFSIFVFHGCRFSSCISFARLPKKRFNNFFPFRVKNRLRWIPLLLLYLFQFLSHFYFYFDLMMLHLRSGMLELQLHNVVKAKCLHKSDSKTYVQCARITIERVLGVFVCLCMCRDVSEFQIVFTFKVFPTNEGLVSGYESIFVNNLWSKMDENVNCLTFIPEPNGNNNEKNPTENLQSKCTFLVFWLLSCFASFPQTTSAAAYQLISFSTNLFTESNDCRLISCIGKLSVCNIKQLMPAYFIDAYELPRCQKTNLHLSNFSSVFFFVWISFLHREIEQVHFNQLGIWMHGHCCLKYYRCCRKVWQNTLTHVVI